MTSPTQIVFKAAIAWAVVSLCASLGANPALARANTVEYVIDNSYPITSADIDRRVNFLRLQRKKASRDAAAQAMIDQTLHLMEMKRLGISVSDAQVNEAYNNFAKSNNATPRQVEQTLDQTGVTKRHFLEFLRATMGWNQALSKRYQSSVSQRDLEQETVQWMLSQGGEKPKSTEYVLQDVIFVIPAKDRNAVACQAEARGRGDARQVQWL